MVLAHIKSLLRHPVDYVATFHPFRSPTDLQRWQDPSNLSPDWDERTRLIAGLIPDGASVIEFGAARLVLPLHLGRGCTYQPVDLVKRSEDTLAFDLNGPLPELPHRYDYAVFSGVLEYVSDVERVMRWLSSVAECVVFSYAVSDYLWDPITRSRHGWVNSFSDSEIRLLVGQAGMDCRRIEKWERQNIYVCHFRSPPAGVKYRCGAE